MGALVGATVKTERWEEVPQRHVSLAVGPTPGKGVAVALSVRF